MKRTREKRSDRHCDNAVYVAVCKHRGNIHAWMFTGDRETAEWWVEELKKPEATSWAKCGPHRVVKYVPMEEAPE